jgi:hypothetical protein
LVSKKTGFGSKTLAGYENKFWSLKNQVLDPKHLLGMKINFELDPEH